MPLASQAPSGESRTRLLWMAGMAAVAFLVILSRLYHLQVLRGDEYRGKAEENFVKELRVPADRGLLLDRNRTVLVDSRPSYDVVLIPYFCGKGCDEVVGRLSALLTLSFEEEQRVREHLATARGLVRFRPFTVKVDITRDELDVVEANRIELSGAVDVVPTPHRSYRHGVWASHLLGYMNEVGPDEIDKLNAELARDGVEQQPYQPRDFVGRRGLERRWERELRGVDGTQRVVVDARGNAKRESDLIPEAQRFEPSTPGNNLVLSLDWRLQELAEKIYPGTAGSVLAMDARTGFILALVDRPAVDPNKLSGRITRAELAAIRTDPLQPELFRAVQQHYHPGSTFKVVTAIAALEEGALRPGGTVHCPGRYTLGGHTWRCDKETGHGNVDLQHALGASCDVFFYALGDRMGTDKIAKWGQLLGLGRPTGLDLAGEIPGVMPDEAFHDARIPGGHQHGMSLNISIGQGDVNVTPLQQLVLYGALATGKVWKPQVVLRVEDPKGEVLKEFAPEVRGTLPVKPETRAAVMEGLLAAVNQPFGTAYGVRLKDTLMAGKTGTAQVVKLGAKRLKASQVAYFQRDHAWFAAFAPADDPEIVVVVLNEHSGFGASNAAPTAAALVKRWLEIKEEDARAREGVQRPAVAPQPAAPAPPPPQPPGRVEKPARAALPAAPGGRRGA
ncbi:MAG TPA: penicillin-binding protein 2 [Anaeromyxobacteraceae bacterium]|nr:penicillin-binding protein 2 [Anaeromyxobacteraceae bacterium]